MGIPNIRVPHVHSLLRNGGVRIMHPRLSTYHCEHCDVPITEEEWERNDGMCVECDDFLVDRNE